MSTYYCTACFEGYFRNGGDCVTLDSVCISSNDPTLTAAVACTVIAD